MKLNTLGIAFLLVNTSKASDHLTYYENNQNLSYKVKPNLKLYTQLRKIQKHMIWATLLNIH